MKVLILVVALLLNACTEQPRDQRMGTSAQAQEKPSSSGAVPPHAAPVWPVPDDAIERPYGSATILRIGDGAIRARPGLNQGVVMFVRYFDREGHAAGSGSWFTSMHELSTPMQQAVAEMRVGELRRVWFASAPPERAIVDIDLLRVDPPSSRPAG